LLLLTMKTISKVYVRLMMALLPFLFLPLIVDSFGFGKMWILGSLVIIGILLWIVAGVVQKTNFKIYWSPVMVATVLWAIWSMVSFFYMPVGLRMKTLTSTSGLAYVLVIVGLVFLWTQNNEDGEGEKQLQWLTVSGLIVAATSLVVFLIPQAKLPILLPKDNPMLAIDQNWSLMGGVMGELALLLTLAGMWMKKMAIKMKGKESYVGAAIVSSLLVLVVFLDAFRMVKTGWGFLDWKNSWIVAVESLKQNPIFGVGIGNFSEAFYWWRGVGFNQSPKLGIGIFDFGKLVDSNMDGNWLSGIGTGDSLGVANCKSSGNQVK